MDQAKPPAFIVNRRSMLSGAAIAAAAISAAGTIRPAAAFDATPADNAPRYQDSEHVKTFYRLAGR